MDWHLPADPSLPPLGRNPDFIFESPAVLANLRGHGEHPLPQVLGILDPLAPQASAFPPFLSARPPESVALMATTSSRPSSVILMLSIPLSVTRMEAAFGQPGL